MLQIRPVSFDAAIAHQRAITNATHLLSCADYLIQALPEDVQELPVMADLTVLLGKVGSEIEAARVKFEREAPQQDSAPLVAPWRNQPQAEQHEFLPESITIQGRRYVPEAA